MKAIAMKATQEDWDSVKHLVQKYEEIASFKNFTYLVTNYRGILGLVSNNDSSHKDLHDRTVHETFNRKILLDALDIVEEKVWKGSEIQVMSHGRWVDCHKLEIYRLKPINPEVKQLKELAEKLGYKIEKL